MIKKLRQLVLKKVNFSLRKNLNGRCFRIPMLAGLGGAMRRHHEPWMLENLIQIAGEAGGAFVDVGVNLGQTLLAVKSIEDDWDYVGFEPNPSCLFYVMNLIQLNQLERCVIYPFGIAGSTGTVDLRLKSLTGGEGSIVPGFRPESEYKRRIKVPVMGPEDLPAELSEKVIGVLKVDVEGGELEVFEAMLPLIEKNRPVIISELLPVYDASSERGSFRKKRQDTLISMMDNLGYSIIRLHPDGRRELLDEIKVHGDMSLTNYLFVPRDRGASFLSE